MTEQILEFMSRGALDFSIWQMLVTLLLMTSVTILSVTIYLHRCEAHRAVDLHPALRHFFRFWVWLTTGMVVREWVSIHRKHHAFCEKEGDPHSPQVFGIAKVLFHGVWLYGQESKNAETVENYGHGCPDDWLERSLYHSKVYGTVLMLMLDVWAFGALGITFWAIQILWIPVSAAGIINGLGHWWGYRNFSTPDTSTNLTPWGLIIGGEELHNNHHAFPSSAKFALRRWEFDVGWLVIRLLAMLRLCTVRRVAPELQFISPVWNPTV
jgi:stearoyl-CoA desaturase (delta-9 desaturase)